MSKDNGNGKNSAPQGITRTPFPGSRRRYIPGKLHNFQVPMREIQLSPTKTEKGMEENAPLCVYDTSGPYTDLDVEIDLKKGLKPQRRDWIMKNGDVEEVEGFYKGKSAPGVEVFPGAATRKPLKAKK